MKKNKLFSLLLAIIMMFTFTFYGQTSALANEINTDNSLFYQEYAKRYLSIVENISPQFTRYLPLYDVDSDCVIAYAFEFQNGYIIININSLRAHEFSISDESPFIDLNQNTKLYYNGLFEYYIKADNMFVHINSIKDKTVDFTNALSDGEMYSVLSNELVLTSTEKNEMLNALVISYQTNDIYLVDEGHLSGTLSTVWKENMCGPNCANAMLRYLGLTNTAKTQYETIDEIASYTGSAVTLSSLRNGINQYLAANGKSARVSSCNYEFYRIVREIDSNQPLTLGTINHVNLVHGFKQEYLTVTGKTIYTIYMNNGGGSNNVATSYVDIYGDDLRDHVYY